MMSDAVTDTHALIWYLEDSPRLSVAADRVFKQCDCGEITIYIPTISLVEITYLQEKGRISPNLTSQLDLALQAGNTGLVTIGLTVEIARALARIPRNLVPDLPDRIIAATAFQLGLPLISCDSKMPATGIPLVW